MLDQLRTTHPQVEIEELEVLTNPVRVLREGIWMIPAVIIGDNRWYHTPKLEELLAALDVPVDG